MKFNKLAVAVFLVVGISSNVIARDYDTKFETDLNIHHKFFKRDRNKDKLLDLNEAYSGFMHTPDYEVKICGISQITIRMTDNRGLDYEEYSNKVISKKGYDKKLKKKKIKDKYIRFTTTMRSYIDFTNAGKNRER
ncbi:hypothetical protein TAO_1273 [Candidatus Nitrosoglobus terrae]|uniref:EF-hand domain-containing protein n=1 Tax=Candidatus Nitrosoglobus terrae TaxID=1630141 RepID=A0A1Q2SNG5_9GAMM|nr:hypothetical protein [Candidatus Nitrosoglobus terrae]BAW80643.1 hypothetical protein TAO_1273 [Candidatus Nitrosoglobus terrae]